MARMNYNRPNGGYERDTWARSGLYDGYIATKKKKVKLKKKKVKTQSLAQTIAQERYFIKGKYTGKLIGTIVDTDPNYAIWILENQPKGIIAQQIIGYFNQTTTTTATTPKTTTITTTQANNNLTQANTNYDDTPPWD